MSGRWGIIAKVIRRRRSSGVLAFSPSLRTLNGVCPTLSLSFSSDSYSYDTLYGRALNGVRPCVSLQFSSDTYYGPDT